MKLSEFFIFLLLASRRESERIEFFLLSAEFEAVRFGALIDKPFGVSHSPFGLNAKKHGDGRVTYLLDTSAQWYFGSVSLISILR